MIPQAGILGILARTFLNKKKIIGWVSAIALTVGAVAVGMENKEFKDAVCGADPISVEK